MMKIEPFGFTISCISEGSQGYIWIVRITKTPIEFRHVVNHHEEGENPFEALKKIIKWIEDR